MNRSRLVLLPAVLALLLAACGGGDDASEPAVSIAASEAAEPSTAPSGAPASEAAASGEATGGETVDLTGFTFTPAELTVPAGTEVTFTNGDDAPHTVTEGVDGEAADDARFDEEVAGGEEVAITFDEPGEYQITCRFHPEMNMTVTVEG